jgi:hypothetical protein
MLPLLRQVSLPNRSNLWMAFAFNTLLILLVDCVIELHMVLLILSY